MRTIDAMKKLARNDGRFTHVYTKKELSELFNETGSKLNGTLKSLIKENILNRAYHNVYVFRFSQYGGLGTLDLIGKKIRPNDSFYESLESSASAWSLISQIPTFVTYMTTGKSKWYNTGYGSIDFVHYSKTDEKPRTIDRSSMGRVPLADKLQTYRDLQKTKRSLDLLREQYDKDHGCRDGNIQYYPCEDDDTWDFLDKQEDVLKIKLEAVSIGAHTSLTKNAICHYPQFFKEFPDLKIHVESCDEIMADKLLSFSASSYTRWRDL